MALSHIYKSEKPSSAREISDLYSLPQHLVANILKQLAQEGVITSTRGPAGGYSLATEPDQISVGTLVDMFEGPFQFMDCGSDHSSCIAAKQCPAKDSLQIVHHKIKTLIDNLSLAEIIQSNNNPCHQGVAL